MTRTDRLTRFRGELCELVGPRFLRVGDLLQRCFVAAPPAVEVARVLEQSSRGRLCIGADADCDLLRQSERARVGVDLNDLSILRPVVEAVLRRRSKRI